MRREFIKKSLFTVFAFLGFSAVLAEPGCSKSKSSDKTTTEPDPDTSDLTCPSGGGITYVNITHAHTTATLGAQDIEDGVAGTFTLLTGSHSHTYDLTVQDFTDIKNGLTVTKIGDNQGHNHNVEIVCS